MKHFHEGLAGWFDYEDVYREAIERAEPGGRLVELGVYMGKSLAFLAVEAHNSGKNLSIVGVDLFLDGQYETVRAMLNANGLHNIRLVKKSTSRASLEFADGSLDFVFVDADHAEGSVFNDIRLYYPKVKPNGWMAGHDLTDEFPGVQKDVTRFFGKNWAPMSKRCWAER